jgi:hypothetical protein
MKVIIAFFVFCLVLFLYLHIQFHLKTSNELELYEIDAVSKERFEEICDLRQPVLFDFNHEKILTSLRKSNILSSYGVFDVKIRESSLKKDTNYLQLPFKKALKLFQSDKESLYFSENNSEFLQETTFVKNLSYHDDFLRPYMVSNCSYDILFGSNICCTPFRYELNYRTFFMLTEGSARIKIAPPNCTKYLHPYYDYENFEFRSAIDVWNPQESYKADFSKIKCLEFVLTPGKTLFLPAFWWYSFEIENETLLACFRYRTYMNTLAISPYFGMYALQNQNVKREFTKKVNIDELSAHEPAHENNVQIMESSTTFLDDLSPPTL